MTSNNNNQRSTARRGGRRPGLAVAACLLTCLVVGCDDGSFRFATVEGVITLDGKPLPDATVRFNPKQQGGSPMVGPSSFGTTDSQGRYTLRTHKGRSGAVVGRHVVSVSTYATELVDPQNSDETRVLSEERVPKRYRTPSELTYEVPSGGTGDANFDLTTS